jgi:hypothetical protein
VTNFTIAYDFVDRNSNFTNATLAYYQGQTYLTYTATDHSIIPINNGSFFVDYNYGYIDPTSAEGILGALIPLLIIVAFIMLVITGSGVF